MQYDVEPVSTELSIIEAEMVSGVSSTADISAASPVAGVSGNETDSVTISDEAILLAEAIVPSIEEQENDNNYNRMIALQGGLVGPGGAMINIASTNEPVYAVLKNGTISVSGMDIDSAQSAYDIKQSTIRMLEYVQLLIQDVKIENSHSLQDKLMNMVNSLANILGEMVGDPGYTQKSESLEEAFKNVTSILIADATRVEYSDLPDNDRMIFEARDMAEMFNNLLFENLTKHGVKKSFDTAWSVL